MSRTVERGVCELLGLELNQAQLGQLETLEVEALEELRATLKLTKTWPDFHPRPF
jgi:hypothetical protein